ncbi:MAG: sigma-54-dependent Fis family transcriptional regulator, partial [Deltaproteobacteria bacterium]|nr:sigma-54-dependent Fis family transcriptional regulator [Deltaproteobacteria bacterium]
FFSFSKLKDAKKVFEDEFIRRKLLNNKNNIAKTAEKIGVDRTLLHKKLKKMV